MVLTPQKLNSSNTDDIITKIKMRSILNILTFKIYNLPLSTSIHIFVIIGIVSTGYIV